MIDQPAVSREFLRLALNSVRYTTSGGAHADIPVVALAIVIALKSGAQVSGLQARYAELDATSAPSEFGAALSVVVRALSRNAGVPEIVTQRIAEQVEDLETRTLQDVWESLPRRSWWTRERLSRALGQLYGLSRGEPNEGAARPWGDLLGRALAELQPEASALGFSIGSGLSWPVDTYQSLVELGLDLSSVTVTGAFATSEEALLPSLIFEMLHGGRFQSGTYEPRRELEGSFGEIRTPEHQLQPTTFDAVFSVWSQPEWAEFQRRGYYDPETELSAALEAVRPGGSMLCLISLETLVNVPLHFTDVLLASRDVLTALLVLPNSWVRQRGSYPDVLLVIQPTKPPYLRDRVLIVDGTEIDQPQTEEAIAELLSHARQGLRAVAEGGAPAGPMVTTINSKRLARTHYLAALEPELAYGRPEGHTERVEVLRARVVGAHERRVAAAQAFREQLVTTRRVAIGDGEAPE